MGVCCPSNSHDSHCEIISRFIRFLPLRKKNALVFNEHVITNIPKDEILNHQKFNQFIVQAFLVNLEFSLSSSVVFLQCREHYIDHLPEFFCALIFLTQSDKLEAKITFWKMMSYYQPTAIREENKVHYIKNETLRIVLKILTNVVSLFPVKILSQFSNNTEEFIATLTSLYEEQNQMKMIEKHLPRVDAGDEEWVDLDFFWENEYYNFSDDNLIRNEIESFVTDKGKNF